MAGKKNARRKSNPKEDFLLIRMTALDRARVAAVAQTRHLDDSTWARQLIMLAVESIEAAEPAVRALTRGSKEQKRIAERPPGDPGR